MNALIAVVNHTLMITAFVGVMMLVIEYVNVMTQGRWQEQLSHRRWGQYLLAAFLGATPGCLGAFAVVAMYSHRRLSLGAVVAAMIATSGDESFVMFAMVPRTALLLTGVLFVVGLLSGALTDRLLGRRLTAKLSCEADFSVHTEEQCHCFPREKLVSQWRHCSATRGTLAVTLMFFLLALVAGQLGPPQWNWIRVSFVLVSSVALFIVATVPDHFLEEHLWRHVVRGHVPRVFLWTLGALVVLHLIVDRWQAGDLIQQSQWIVLAIAGLIGLVPESGPHLIFVTMFAKGVVPFSILLASSIVQDGHGMLPLLAHSRRAFLVIKLINLIVGLAIGALLMAIGR
ncbi:MAG: putative manganese transporter [Kiritimatiellia bacterium]